MRPRLPVSVTYFVLSFSLIACNLPSRTIHETYFINAKSLYGFDIPLAKKDSLAIYANVTLSEWEVPSGDTNLDSIKKEAKDSCQIIIEISSNNKGVVQINDFDIQLFYIKGTTAHDQLNFKNFCKRNDWDLQCFKSGRELKDSLKKIGYDKMGSSQLLIRQEAYSPKLFELQKLYAKIKLKAKYNDWVVNLDFVDTLSRNEIIKDYALHP
jgi:mRNA-degrading endonuclease HigB of HigAB toxin-antitoxin module